MKTKRYMLFVVLLAGLFAATNTLTAQTIRYVTAAGTGGGTSWSDASGDLQGMINASNANDQVWVAKGTYYPTTTTDQSLYFSMKNGVKIYGSFAGTEIVFTDRTSSVMAGNPSVLSGDIDKNNILDNRNSVQVIYNYGNITASAVLDGFIVSGGYSTNGFDGGGMTNYQSSPTVSNCTFSGNYANSGGGMLNYNSSPVISNCSFSGNTASLGGAGLSNNYFSNPAIINCIFSGNSAENGGGIEIYFSSTATITNCTFSGNSAFDGGGILNDGSGSAIITNCSFSGNSGGSIQTYSNSNTTVTNSISWGDDSEIGNSNGGTSSVTNSIVQGGYPGTGNLNVDPRFVNQPPVALATGGNLRLQQTSCAIDAGNNSGLSSGITTDLAGNPRIYNNGIVDMGAYEYQGTKQAYVYIPPATTTGNALNFDGTNDYVSLSTSDLTACTGTIPAVSNAITIAYWFKGTNIQSAVRFQDSHGFIVAGWTGTGATALHILSNDGGTTGIAVGAAATDGNWHHVAMTWQQGAANGFKSYLDGQLIAQRDAGNTSLPAINSLFLGSQGGNSEFMNGSLDEVQVWNTALSQAAIQAGMSGITAPQTGLLMYYKFDHGVANGNNSGVNQLLNSASPNIYAGTLYNFALTGTSSNWVNGFIQPATTTDSSSSNPSCQGSSVTFTSTVLINGNTAEPANTGTVTFTQGTTVLAGNVAVDANGHAAFSTDTLGAGSHLIVATYNAPTGFSTSNGSVNQVVNARPTGLISGGATYCNGSGTTTNLTITVTGTGTISGTLSDNTPFSGTAPTINVSVSPTVTTNYTIKSLSDASCTAQSSDFSGSATVTVNARPTGSISGGATYCNGSGTTTNLAITVTGTGTISGTLSDNTPFSGTAPTINVSVSPTVTTNYTIKSLSDAGCTAQSSDFSGTATVTVNARPTGYISGGATYCSGSNTTTNLTITVTGSGTVKGTLSDNTPFSGTAPTISVAVSPTATTIYTIATLNDANCTALSSDLSGNAMVAINATPDPPASGGNQAQCQQSPIQTLMATATGGVITWYNMATGGSVVANPTLSNVGSITYYAQASNGNCSSATRTAVTLTINPLPAVAAITYTGNTTVCSGAVVALTDLTAGGVWSTSGNSAAVSSSGTVTFATVSASTPVTVYYTVSGSGCSANAPVVFTVNPPIILKPITGNSTVCGIGATTQLSEATGGGSWSSSNTAVAVVSATGLVTGKGIGSAIIYYAASSGGCTASVQTNVAVNTGTTVAAITGGNQVIKSCSIQLSDATKGGAWSSSNTAVATVSTTGLVKGMAAGNCLIYYTVSSGVCSVPVSKSITVYNPLTAAVTAGKILCNGGTTTVTITASGGSGGYQYSLNAGRFQVSNTFTVAAGSYIIIITDQMANQFTLSGIIVTQPAALAIKLVSQTNATGKTTANGVFAVSGSGGTAPYQYSTNGGAGYQASGTFTGLIPGSYKVSVKDANNCVALNYLTVSVGYNTKSSAVGATELLASNEDDNDETVSASVYPNPTISSFNVKLKSGKDQVVDIRVMDILGRMVYHTTGSATATYQFGNNFIKGTYIVQVIYEKSAKTFKVLKQ